MYIFICTTHICIIFYPSIAVQEKIELLSERLERESCIGEKPNTDTVDFDVKEKAAKQKCKQSPYNCVC